MCNNFLYLLKAYTISFLFISAIMDCTKGGELEAAWCINKKLNKKRSTGCSSFFCAFGEDFHLFMFNDFHCKGIWHNCKIFMIKITLLLLVGNFMFASCLLYKMSPLFGGEEEIHKFVIIHVPFEMICWSARTVLFYYHFHCSVPHGKTSKAISIAGLMESNRNINWKKNSIDAFGQFPKHSFKCQRLTVILIEQKSTANVAWAETWNQFSFRKKITSLKTQKFFFRFSIPLFFTHRNLWTENAPNIKMVICINISTYRVFFVPKSDREMIKKERTSD